MADRTLRAPQSPALTPSTGDAMSSRAYGFADTVKITRWLTCCQSKGRLE